jgi:hypothetical protein
MNTLVIKVDDIAAILATFSQLKVYRAPDVDGVYAEITGPGTRPVMTANQEIYNYTDSTGVSSSWYKIAYFNPSGPVESESSDPIPGGTSGKIGFTFGNYKPPTGQFGEIFTADDIRYSFCFGIDLRARDGTYWTDEQITDHVHHSTLEFERRTGYQILQRRIACHPEVTGKVFGTDYEIEEAPYPYRRDKFGKFGWVTLRRRPVISVERFELYSQVESKIIDLSTWIRLDKQKGVIHYYPRAGQPTSMTNPYIFAVIGGFQLPSYPHGYRIDYTVGLADAARLDDDLREIIGKMATMDILKMVSDAQLGGLASASLSMDGVSESFSSTNSGQSVAGDTRIAKHNGEWITIREMFRKRDTWIGKKVLSLDVENQIIEPKEVLDVMKHHVRKNQKCYYVTTENGFEIHVTEDHSLYVQRGSEQRVMPGEEIRVGDMAVVSYDGAIHNARIVSKVERVATEMYDISVKGNENFIGNGFVAHNSVLYGARIKQYEKDVEDWFTNNRFRFGRLKMGNI